MSANTPPGKRDRSPSSEIVRGINARPNWYSTKLYSPYISTTSDNSIYSPNKDFGSIIYKEPKTWKPISTIDRITQLKSNSKWSPKVERYLPTDFNLPPLSYPLYVPPASDSTTWKTWIATYLFEGIVPDASKIVNPQVNSREILNTVSPDP